MKITSPALCSHTAFLGSERQDWDCAMLLLHKGAARGALAAISFYCTTEVEIGESSVFVQLGGTRGYTKLMNRLGGWYYSAKFLLVGIEFRTERQHHVTAEFASCECRDRACVQYSILRRA